MEMKCPQLSKPEATAARNQNSIGDRMEKKTLGETRLSGGSGGGGWGGVGAVLLWPDEPAVCSMLHQSQIVIYCHKVTSVGHRCIDEENIFVVESILWCIL